MRLGIYGGSYDPPHLGHMEAAKWAVSALELDELLLIPSCHTPGKPGHPWPVEPVHRLKMLQMAAEEIPCCRVSDLELRRGGESYTLHTLQALRAQYPDAELVLLLGTDMFLGFTDWYKPKEILALAALAVFCRGGRVDARLQAQKEVIAHMGGTVHLLDKSANPISSTQLRRMLIFRCAGAFLPEGVEDYILKNRLYGTGEDFKNLPIERLRQVVRDLLKPQRVAHVMGCCDTAVELARRWGADPVDAARAALLHDVTKALDGPHQLTFCKSWDIRLDPFSGQNPKTLHALTGSLVANEIFGEKEAVVSAIASHTTGKPGMNTLEKIIYVADYMEPNRDFPGVDRLRSLAYSDLDGALELGLEMTITLLREQGRDISPASQEALEYLKRGKTNDNI